MNLRKNKTILTAMLVIIMGFTNLLAQDESANYHTINGVVKDSRTQRPIAFASVFILEDNIGTVTNLNGNFTLKVQKSSDATEFSISHLGYHTKKFNTANHIGSGQEFLLETHSVELDEVTVLAADPKMLVTKALENVASNYPVIPQRLTGFYRETIKQRRDYLSISEAIVEVYQAPYNSQYQNDRTRIIQGRKSGNVKKADTLLLKLQGGPYVSMLLDIVKNQGIVISSETIDIYEYEFLEVVKLEGQLNYVIGFKPRLVFPFPLYLGKFYISVDDIAITMADFSLDLSDKSKAVQNFVVKKPARLRFNPQNTRYLVTYKKIDDKYHLNYVRTELEFQADWRRRLFRTGYSIMSEMAITERQTENVERISHRESFRPNAILADLVPVYFDDDFWGDYNYIEPEESIETAIKKFNRRFPDTGEVIE